ncbi:MAG TPA: type VI secretion system tip protein TssI/VgrG [Minicystis sp.]|nr:type VI secretion system tip protein TssI/VgrG [Minicystis sp.]
MTLSEDGAWARGGADVDPAALAREKVLYSVNLGGIDYLAREASGVEAMSRPFSFRLKLFVESLDAFDPDRLTGSRCAVAVARGTERRRNLVGVATDVSVDATATGKPDVEITVEPRLALLREKSDFRVFCDQTVPEIVARVLDEGHVTHAERLREAYPRRPYTVQYRESDLDFVHRLLEDEGIHYVLLDDEEGTMLLADHPTAYAPADGGARPPAVPFVPATGLDLGAQAIHAFGRRARLAPSSVTLRDFNPDHPQLDMDVAADGPCPAGLEHYDYPGKYALPTEGTRKARLRAVALACAASPYVGTSGATDLAPGRTFALADAPGGLEGEYVTTRVEHAYSFEAGRFTSRVEALRADVTFRPERVTPSPVVTGVLPGFVMGPAGEDVHTDELGRVKVRFPWDRRSLHDDTASHWIPVLQDDTGHSAGIPRVGWEVLVAFIEGDPDRPVVLGRLYDAADPFPEVLPENKTVSVLQSLTTPSRDGANLIRFEDKAGSEQIFMQAQKDQKVTVANDKREKVGDSEFNTTSGDESVAIGNDHTAHVGEDRSLTVSGDQSITVRGARRREVGAEDKADVAGSRSISIGASHTRKIDGYDAVRVGSLTEKVGAIDLEASLKKNDTSAGMMASLTVGGAVVELTASEKDERCKALRVETIGGLVFTRAGADVRLTADSRTTTIGGVLSVDALAKLSLLGGLELDAEALEGAMDATTSLTLVAGKSAVTLKDGNIAITTDQNIQLESRGKSHLGASVAALKKGG